MATPAIAPMDVIMVTAEDPLDQELVPRLLAAGADFNRVHFLQYIKTDELKRQFLLGEDLQQLERDMARIGRVGMITVDPITAYMGKINSHSTTDVRSQLGPLKDFSEANSVCISAVTHPAKDAGQRAINHFIGSQAFIAAGRLGHVCIEETKIDEMTGNVTKTGRVLYAHVKHNPFIVMPTLAYHVQGGLIVGQDPITHDNIEGARVVWADAPVDITADAAVAAAAGKTKRGTAPTEAQRWLHEKLSSANARTAPQQEIIEEGAREGFSEKQLRTAKRKLGVASRKTGFEESSWVWTMPPTAEEAM